MGNEQIDSVNLEPEWLRRQFIYIFMYSPAKKLTQKPAQRVMTIIISRCALTHAAPIKLTKQSITSTVSYGAVAGDMYIFFLDTTLVTLPSVYVNCIMMFMDKQKDFRRYYSELHYHYHPQYN